MLYLAFYTYICFVSGGGKTLAADNLFLLQICNNIYNSQRNLTSFKSLIASHNQVICKMAQKMM